MKGFSHTNPINRREAAQLKSGCTVLKTCPTVPDKKLHNGIFVRRRHWHILRWHCNISEIVHHYWIVCLIRNSYVNILSMHKLHELAEASWALNSVCICLCFQFCFPQQALRNHCSVYLLLKLKSNRTVWYCPMVRSSPLELQAKFLDLWAIGGNMVIHVKWKAVTSLRSPKREPSGSYSVIGGMVQNECGKIDKPEGTALTRAGCALDKMLALERSGNEDPH